MDYTKILNNFKYLNESKKPYYFQLAEFLIENIKLNNLKQLPSERTLASYLNVSRLTINKAYNFLKGNGIIFLKKGNKYEVSNSNKRQKAFFIINEVIEKLLKDGWNFLQIKDLFNTLINVKELNDENINVLFIDCNIEAYFIVREQLKKSFKINLYFLPIQYFSKKIDIKDLFSKINNYDLIITTSTHYKDLNRIFANNHKKIPPIFSVSLDIDKETVLKIGRIKENEQVMVLSLSSKFNEIIQIFFSKISFNEKIEYIDIENLNNSSNIEDELNEKFLSNNFESINYLIIPYNFNFSDYMIFINNYLNNQEPYNKDIFKKINQSLIHQIDNLIYHFNNKIIQFNYKLDSGSLLLIEEKIRQISEKKIDEFVRRSEVDE